MASPYFKVGLFSHHFVLTEVTPSARPLVEAFAKNFVQYGLVKAGRRFVRAPVKVFGVRLADYSEYRFQIHQWSMFTKHMTNHGIEQRFYEITLHEPDDGVDIEIATLPKWQEHDYQVPIGEYLVSDKPSKIKMLEIQTGRGKSLPMDVKVKIPGGWTTMGELQPGDTIIAKDGTPTQVTGVFPQGRTKCSEITFGDLRSVKVSNDHLWTIHVPAVGEKVVTTDVIKDYLSEGVSVFIDLVKSEQGPYLILPADPYLMGEAMVKGRFPYTHQQVMGFFEGSHQQRLSFLQGALDKLIIDTRSDGKVLFTGIGQREASWIQYLVRSLGGTSSLLQVCDDQYTLEIDHPTPSQLSRNAQRKAYLDKFRDVPELKLQVFMTEAVEDEETVCISIDHPDKEFVVGDFIATHNTFCAMNAVAKLGKRLAIVIKPAFMEKWLSDVEKICGIAKDEVTMVQGSTALMSLMARAEAGLITEKVIIFSNRTLQNFFSLYETKGRDVLNHGYAFLPQELFPKLGVGVRLIDEVHMDFHFNVKLDLYTQVSRSISLSATLKSDDAFMNRMYETMYPQENRYAGLAYDKYVTAYSWMYHVRRPELIRVFEPGSSTYSHHAFEKSVFRQPTLLDDYLDMIVRIAKRFYLSEDYKPGDRLLVYAASIDMCTRITDFLKLNIKDKDIRRYCEEDAYENLMEAEICVSTVLSAGTGHDIAQLTTVILTTSILSHQSNVQGFGRLRKIPGRKVRFIYLSCADVPKHLEYHAKKKELLKTIALDYNTVTYPHTLG